MLSIGEPSEERSLVALQENRGLEAPHLECFRFKLLPLLQTKYFTTVSSSFICLLLILLLLWQLLNLDCVKLL